MTFETWRKPHHGRAFFGAVLFLGGLSMVAAFFASSAATPNWLDAIPFERTTPQWYSFLLLASLATVTLLFPSDGPSHQVVRPAIIFFFAGVILLQPFLYALLITSTMLVKLVKAHLIGRVRLQYSFIHFFNLAMHILCGLAAQQVYLGLTRGMQPRSHLLLVAAGLVAALAYVLLNHVISGEAVVLVRGMTWKETEALHAENVFTDFLMLVQGFMLALALHLSPWLVLPAMAPLFFIYRALAVPGLRRQARTDSKTGLWNARHFMEAMEAERSRALRFGRPLTVVIADLDLLRNINTVYGHLAGDAVLAGVAQILKRSARRYDFVARFGGEEFAIMMPETFPKDALKHIEDIRKKIEDAVFEDPIQHRSIRVTMSFGISGGWCDDRSIKLLIYEADMAVYQAKIQGRNQTCVFEPVTNYPYSIPSNV